MLGYHLYSPLRANKLLRRRLYGHRSSSFVVAGTLTHGYCSKILPLLVSSSTQERQCRSRFELAYPGRYHDVTRRRIGITTQALSRILLR